MLRSNRQKLRKAPVRAANTRIRGAASPGVDYKALAEFRYQLRKFLSFSETAAHKAGLTPQHHQALLAIKGFSSAAPVSIGDLADFLLVRHHTAVELVDRMAKLGLVARNADEDDSRRIVVKLTRKGEQKLQTLSKIHFEELHAASPVLTRLLRSFRRSQKR